MCSVLTVKARNRVSRGPNGQRSQERLVKPDALLRSRNRVIVLFSFLAFRNLCSVVGAPTEDLDEWGMKWLSGHCK